MIICNLIKYNSSKLHIDCGKQWKVKAYSAELKWFTNQGKDINSIKFDVKELKSQRIVISGCEWSH